MQNFQIFDDEHPAPTTEQSYTQFDEGNWQRIGVVWAFDDPGEPIQVWVAEKRRVAIAELEDDQPFVITSGVYA